MSNYCERHGHDFGYGGMVCMNCGHEGKPAKMCPECKAVGGPDGVTNCATCRGDFWGKVPPELSFRDMAENHRDHVVAARHADADEPPPVRPLTAADEPFQVKVTDGTMFQGDGAPYTKPSNPKDAIGMGKLPMHLVPTAVTRYAALSFAEGALKYGKYNWRVAGVRMSIYLDALHRHLAKLQDGEWADEMTQVPHLASIIACSGIILDAFECDKLTDDRPPVNVQAGPDMETRIAHLAHLKEIFKAHSPHQNVITDATQSPK